MLMGYDKDLNHIVLDGSYQIVYLKEGVSGFTIDGDLMGFIQTEGNTGLTIKNNHVIGIPKSNKRKIKVCWDFIKMVWKK